MNQSPLRRAVDDFTFDAQPTPVEQARTQAMTQNSLTRGFRQDALASEADALNRQALEAEAAGDPNWQTYRAQAQAKQQEAAEFSSAVPSFRDIRSVGDAMEYAGHTIGSAAGSMLPSIAGAAAGRVLTPFKAAKDAVSAMGAAAPAYQREVGAQAGRQYDDPNQMAHSAELRHDLARLTGVGSAALEAVVPQSIARSALSPSQRIARSVGREALEEGATETAQEALTHQAGSVLGSQDELTGAELLDAAVGGAIGGAGVSAGARIPGAALQQGTQYLANAVRDGVDSVQSTMSQRSAEAENIRQQYEALNQQKQDSYVDRLINKSTGVPDSLGDLADSARADLADTPAEQLRGASFEETERNLAADDEARAARAQQYAEAILADDATPPATRQIVESALQDLSNPDNRAQIAGIMARKADLEQVKRASEDLDSLLPKDDKIIKHSLAGMPASMDAQITDTLIQHMKPELANSMSAKELAELSTFGKKLVAFSTRVDDTALDRSDAETLFRLGETMDMFQDPEATIAALQQIGGVQSMGMAPGANWINQVRAVRSASTDVDEPMSFLSLMLKDADLPPQNVKLVAKAVDQFTALENAGKTEKATAFRNALVEVFGSPQNVDTVLQYYAKKNSQSLVQASEAHAMLADPDSGVQERGGDFGVNYEDAKAQRPYFRPARTIEKGEQALKATLGENATLKRRSYWDVAQEKGLDAKQERSRLATDLKGRITKAEKSLQGDKPEFQEMRKQAIRRMQGELYYLESDMYPDEDVLNQYEVIETGSGEVDTTVAQDSDLKGMSALLKDPSAAKTKITFKKKDGKTLQLSAESMWRAWAKKNGTPIPENKRAVQEAFGDALAAVMARPDIEGFAEGQDMKGILIHRGLQLPATFPNIKKQGMKTHEIGQRIKRNEKVTPEERERHDKAKKRRYARERAAESNPYTSVVAEVLQGIERGIEGKQITKSGKTTRHEYVDHREKIQEFSDYLASEADHWTAVIDSETTPAAKYEARTRLAQVRDAQAQIREAVSDAEFTFRDENRAGTPEPNQSDSRPRKYEEDTGAPIGHGRAPGSVKDSTNHGDGKIPSTEYVAVASTVDEVIKEVAQRARNMKSPLLRNLARYVQVDPYLPTAGRATKDGRILISPKVLTDTAVRERLGQRFPMIAPDQLVDVILAHEMFHQIDRNLGHISHKMESTFNAVMQVRDTLPWLDYLTDEMSPQTQRREVFAQIMALDTYAPEYLKEAFPKGSAFAKKVREYIDAQPTPPTSPRGTHSDSAERQAPQKPGRRAEQGKPAARQAKAQQGARSEVADQLALDDSWWGSRPQEFQAMGKTVTQLVKRLRGDNVITQFLRHADMLAYKEQLGIDKNDSSVGLYVADPVRRTRTVSVSSVADDPMVTAAHEAFHDFMAMLKAEPTPEARRLHKLLLEANRNKDLVAQLKQYKAKERTNAQTSGTLKEFDDYLFNDPEEFVTTLLEGYYAGEIKLDSAPVIRTVFDQILDWVRKLVEAADRQQIYKETFDAFLNGKFADDRMTTSLKTFSTSKTLSEKIKHVGAPLSRLYSALMDTALDQLRASGSPSLVQLSHLFFRDVEFAGEKSDTKLPFLQARQQQHSKWLNRLSEIMAGAEESEVKAALANLQSMKEPESDLEKAITGLLADMHKYMDQAGVQVFDPQKKTWRALGKVDRYFPRVWDKELIRRNEEKFRQLLIPYIGEKQANATIKAITAGDGSLDLSESEKSMGFTPYADSVQNRQFTFIDKTNAHQFAEFQTQDMAYILASYIQKATHRAEYARSFGNDGAVISKLLAQALNEGVDEKEMGRAIKAVKAMEGTLGQGMSDGLKSLFGGIISFQNLVLLPTALFSSLVDPLGISVKTGDFQHAKRAFMNGLKELKKQLSPFVPEGGPTEEERIARLLGTIDDENMLQLLGTQYQAGYLGTGLKKANAWFFRANGMEGWNRAMRVTATTIARETIPTYLQGGQWNKLRELGVTKKSFIRTTQDGKLMVEEDDFKAAGFNAVEARQAATEAQAAVMRWVDSVILRPHAGHRPAWGSDPMWSLAFHLKQFTWSFQNTILRGQFDKLKAGDRSALKPLLAYIPFSMASILAKGLLIGTAIPTDAGVMTARATERSGLLGTHEIAAKALMDIASGKPPMDLLGPTGEHVQSLLLAMADGQVTPGEADSMLDRSVPFHKLAGDRLGASLAR